MTIFTDGVRESAGVGVHELEAPLGDYLYAKAAESFHAAPLVRSYDTNELAGAERSGNVSGIERVQRGEEPAEVLYGAPPAVPQTPVAEARERIKQEGLDGHLKLPEAPSLSSAALDIMIERAKRKRDLDSTIARGPSGFVAGALGVGTSFLVGALDPLNVASAFIPVIGEARYAKLLAGAGESAVRRAGVRIGVGSVEGAAGAAALEPIQWRAATQEGSDYTMADALRSVMFGAGLGAGLHGGGGAIADIYRSRRGTPLYPFAPGEPHFKQIPGLGTHVPAAVLAEEGVPASVLNAQAPRSAWDHYVAGLEDLPPQAKEDLLRGAIASLHDGKPVSAWEQMVAGAKTDPRIAESVDAIEAWHGSPHDFERFDRSKIGTGEGSQSYGHGLYMAEAPDVAREYQKNTSHADFIRKARELYGEFDSPSDAHEALAESKNFTSSQKRLLAALEKDDWLGFDYPHQAVSAAVREPDNFDMSAETHAALRELGNLYKVRINADKQHFLDWDKPVSEQPQALRDLLAKHGVTETKFGEPITTGEKAYEALKDALATHKKLPPDKNGMYRMDDGREAASKALAEAGIPGLKYLDQGSRPQASFSLDSLKGALAKAEAAGDQAEVAALKAEIAAKENPTHNFVVFDDKLIDITHKNGEPVAQDNLPERFAALSADAKGWPQLPQGATIAGSGKNGPILRGLEDRWTEAFEWLVKARTGDAIGVLEHPDVGRIDVVYGNRTRGLGHIMSSTRTHSVVLADLPDRLARMEVIRREPDRITLYDRETTTRAVVRTDWDGESKRWLLTAFEEHKPGEGPRGGGGGPKGEGPEGKGPVGEGTSLSPTDDVGPAQSPEGSPVPPGKPNITDPSAERDAAWHDLASRPEDFDEPEAVEASQAAAKLPEPASVSPEPNARIQAAEKAAAEAEAEYRLNEAYLPEDLRQAVEDRIAAIDAEAKDRTEILQRGAACLSSLAMVL